MCIPQDIVSLIIDQLVLGAGGTALVASRYGTVCPRSLARDLRATSLVSTRWVNHSQHYLFSTIVFSQEAHVWEWCSRIRPGPRGVSRHVRVLKLKDHLDILETALPHLTSFQNLQELVMYHGQADAGRVSLDVLVPIFSSFATTLKRLQWSQEATAPDARKALYTLTDLLPNLVEIDLSSVWSNRCLIRPPVLPRINLSSGRQPPDLLAFKHLKFQELWATFPVPPLPQFLEYCCTYLRVLSFGGLQRGDDGNLRALFGACNALQEVNFTFYSFIGHALGLCPSNSVSLIRIHNPPSTTRTSYDTHILGCSKDHCDFYEHSQMRECERLCASIRKIAQRFFAHNYGSKTRVQVVYDHGKLGGKTTFIKEIPFFIEKLKEELGTCATLDFQETE